MSKEKQAVQIPHHQAESDRVASDIKALVAKILDKRVLVEQAAQIQTYPLRFLQKLKSKKSIFDFCLASLSEKLLLEQKQELSNCMLQIRSFFNYGLNSLLKLYSKSLKQRHKFESKNLKSQTTQGVRQPFAQQDQTNQSWLQREKRREDEDERSRRLFILDIDNLLRNRVTLSEEDHCREIETVLIKLQAYVSGSISSVQDFADLLREKSAAKDLSDFNKQIFQRLRMQYLRSQAQTLKNYYQKIKNYFRIKQQKQSKEVQVGRQFATLKQYEKKIANLILERDLMVNKLNLALISEKQAHAKTKQQLQQLIRRLKLIQARRLRISISVLPKLIVYPDQEIEEEQPEQQQQDPRIKILQSTVANQQVEIELLKAKRVSIPVKRQVNLNFNEVIRHSEGIRSTNLFKSKTSFRVPSYPQLPPQQSFTNTQEIIKEQPCDAQVQTQPIRRQLEQSNYIQQQVYPIIKTPSPQSSYIFVPQQRQRPVLAQSNAVRQVVQPTEPKAVLVFDSWTQATPPTKQLTQSNTQTYSCNFKNIYVMRAETKLEVGGFVNAKELLSQLRYLLWVKSSDERNIVLNEIEHICTVFKALPYRKALPKDLFADHEGISMEKLAFAAQMAESRDRARLKPVVKQVKLHCQNRTVKECSPLPQRLKFIKIQTGEDKRLEQEMRRIKRNKSQYMLSLTARRRFSVQPQL